MMRAFKFLVIISILFSFCGERDVVKTEVSKKSPDFPYNYKQWVKVNSDTIFRVSEKVSREIYINSTGLQKGSSVNFPYGTVLVKEESRIKTDSFGNPLKGDVFQISVMIKREGAAEGWVFKAFDYASESELPVEKESCVLCHAKRKGFDWTFSDFSKIYNY